VLTEIHARCLSIAVHNSISLFVLWEVQHEDCDLMGSVPCPTSAQLTLINSLPDWHFCLSCGECGREKMCLQIDRFGLENAKQFPDIILGNITSISTCDMLFWELTGRCLKCVTCNSAIKLGSNTVPCYCDLKWAYCTRHWWLELRDTESPRSPFFCYYTDTIFIQKLHITLRSFNSLLRHCSPQSLRKSSNTRIKGPKVKLSLCLTN
jgi:hypothetical protein